MRLASFAVVAVALAAGTARADDGNLEDTLGPREIAVGEGMRGGATGATAIALNPAGLPLNREFVFEGGYGYRGSDDATMLETSLCDSTSGIPGCFFYDYAGTNPDSDGMTLHTSTNLAGLAVARALLPRVYVGAVARYFNVSSAIPGMTSSGFNFDLGAEIRLSESISIGASGQNLFGSSSPALPAALGGGVYIKPVSMLSLGFDARWRLDGPSGARYGGGAELFLRSSSGQVGVPLRAGALHDDNLNATYLSCGLGLAMMKWGLDIGARKSISGPNDLAILASMRIYGPRLPAPPSE